MSGIPSIGIIEIIILAGVIGTVLLTGGLVVALVARIGRDRRTRAVDQLEPDTPTSRSPKLGIWLLLLGLVAVLAVPLVAIIGGILIVTPVRSSRTDHPGPDPQVHVVSMSTPIVTALVATPSATPQPASQVSSGLAESPPPVPVLLALTPDNDLLFVIVPGISALAVLSAVMVIAVVLTRFWNSNEDPEPGTESRTEWANTSRLRYVLLALAIWFALSIFLILDVGFAVSVYLQFVAIYAAFCVLIGALLLVGSPRREKLLILGLLVTMLFSIRLVNWNSRKPFLKDFYRVREGMTVGQVEQIMEGYMGGSFQPERTLAFRTGESAAETEDLAPPDRAVYRHTNEGWGNSDWGEIIFEKGRVVEIRFLPD